ncbi:unnamed protein product, partial [Cuscuta europaea]
MGKGRKNVKGIKIPQTVARVLIEVDVSKPPPLSVKFKLKSGRFYIQYVIYDTFHDYYFHCKKFGHRPFTCNVLHEFERKEREDEVNKRQVGIAEKRGDPIRMEAILEKKETTPEIDKSKGN